MLLLHRRLLDVLSVGDEEAATLGVNVNRTRLVVVVFATVGTAAAVAGAGARTPELTVLRKRRISVSRRR